MVVVSAFVILFVTLGTAYSFTAFFAPLQKTFGASRGDISLIFSINIPLVYLLGASAVRSPIGSGRVRPVFSVSLSAAAGSFLRLGPPRFGRSISALACVLGSESASHSCLLSGPYKDGS